MVMSVMAAATDPLMFALFFALWANSKSAHCVLSDLDIDNASESVQDTIL